MKIRSGCEGGGKGALVQTEKSATLTAHPDQALITLALDDDAYCIGTERSPTLKVGGNGVIVAQTSQNSEEAKR